MSEVFGFHTVEENLFSADDWSFTETYYDAQNILNVLGWFPGLGTITGAIRVGATIVMWIGDEESHRSSHKKYFVVSGIRGVVEMFGLGWLFIIPDLISLCRPRKFSSRFRGFRKWRGFKKRQAEKKFEAQKEPTPPPSPTKELEKEMVVVEL